MLPDRDAYGGLSALILFSWKPYIITQLDVGCSYADRRCGKNTA